MTLRLMIVGASVRAAAASAVRAGWEVEAADLFADADLRALCPVHRVEDYPGDFPRLLAHSQSTHWIYTGALENHPEFLEPMQAIRPLLGTPAEVVRQVRNPWRLAECLARHSLPYPAVRRIGQPPPVTRDPPGEAWLVKSVRSAGGQQVAWAAEMRAEPATSVGTARLAKQRRDRYEQCYLPGVPESALYVAEEGEGGGRRVELLGVSRQLIGCSWAGARTFQYCGSVGPLPLDTRQTAEWTRIGKALVGEFALRGVFGVDVIRQANTLWTLEVNPRYTASTEIHERAWRSSVLPTPRQTAAGQLIPSGPFADQPAHSRPIGGPTCWGKAILFAPRRLVIPAHIPDRVEVAGSSITVADVPVAGTRLGRGEPILTIFASAAAEEVTVQALQRGGEYFQQWLAR